MLCESICPNFWSNTNLEYSSAADEITKEVVAIKLVTRVSERIQLAKRALREITLLRHFAHHENITGLIDADALSPDLTEMCVINRDQSYLS